jgi:hypothetical protein
MLLRHQEPSRSCEWCGLKQAQATTMSGQRKCNEITEITRWEVRPLSDNPVVYLLCLFRCRWCALLCLPQNWVEPSSKQHHYQYSLIGHFRPLVQQLVHHWIIILLLLLLCLLFCCLLWLKTLLLCFLVDAFMKIITYYNRRSGCWLFGARPVIEQHAELETRLDVKYPCNYPVSKTAGVSYRLASAHAFCAVALDQFASCLWFRNSKVCRGSWLAFIR